MKNCFPYKRSLNFIFICVITSTPVSGQSVDISDVSVCLSVCSHSKPHVLPVFVDDVVFLYNGSLGIGPNKKRCACFVKFARWRHQGRSLPSPTASVCTYYLWPWPALSSSDVMYFRLWMTFSHKGQMGQNQP